jgi:glycosyltransferase involved in cell wall biosynthesis
MHIAVIIPAWNVAAFLPDCLLSLASQTHEDWSAVVVDDGSTDGTDRIARDWGDSRVAFIQAAHAGVSAARNRGMAASLRRSPDALLFLDGDDWLAPDALSRLASELGRSPWAAAAAGSHARVGGDGVSRTVRAPPDGAVLSRLLVRNLFANGGQILVRREAIEAAGLFRPDLRFGEDWEYWTRLAALGEFASLPSGGPVLFVRERPGSAYRTMATDPACCCPCLDAIFANPAVTARFGAAMARHLRARAEAEAAWAAGRELIRHGRLHDGRTWLARSFRDAPNPRRLALLGLSWLRTGPFRPYPPVRSGRFEGTVKHPLSPVPSVIDSP